MQTAKSIVAVLVFSTFAALASAHATPGEPSADREAALLHRRVDLGTLKQWNRSSGTWRPLALPPATVYVVNLWSIQCKPCLEEFPFLKNVLAGWKAKPEVQFLFIADPPGETSEGEAAAFWRKSMDALPDTDPCRAANEDLRRVLEDGAEPITLLLDEQMVIRQAFIGSIGGRPLGRSIERLLRAVKGKASAGRSKHEGRRRTL